MSPGGAFNSQVLSLPMIGAVEPPGNAAHRVGDMTGKGGRVHVKFDDVVGFPETGLNIPIVDVGIGDISLFGGIVAPSHSKPSGARFGRGIGGANDRRIGLSPLEQVHHMGEHFPFNVEPPQSFFADVFVFGHDDNRNLGPFLVRDVVKKRLGRPHESAAGTQVLDVLIFPGDDIDDSGYFPGFLRIHADNLCVRVGALQKFGVKHSGNGVVDAVFCDSCRYCVRQPPGEVGLADDPEIFPLSVYSCQISHTMRLLSFSAPLP